MHTKISPQTKHELLHAIRERYQQATRIEKTRILDEYVAVAECYRKHAIRLLTGVDPIGPEPPIHGRRIYAEAVREALIVLWEAAVRCKECSCGAWWQRMCVQVGPRWFR